jgi:hypothetical protein
MPPRVRGGVQAVRCPGRIYTRVVTVASVLGPQGRDLCAMALPGL